MINNHLSETEVQQFIFERDACGMEIIEHVSKCEMCRIKASNYKIIGDNLKLVEKASFNFDLAQTVVDQIISERSSQKHSINLFFAFLFGLIAVCIVGAAGYFIINAFQADKILSGFSNHFWFLTGFTIVIITSTYLTEIFSRHRKIMRMINTP